VDVKELERQALSLEPADRARLAEKLLESLEALTDEENAEAWMEEAKRRDAELDADPARMRPAEDVLRRARARHG